MIYDHISVYVYMCTLYTWFRHLFLTSVDPSHGFAVPGRRASGGLRPVEPQEPGRSHREGRVPMVRRRVVSTCFHQKFRGVRWGQNAQNLGKQIPPSTFRTPRGRATLDLTCKKEGIQGLRCWNLVVDVSCWSKN